MTSGIERGRPPIDGQRLVDIEAKLAHQEVLIGQMSDVIYDQQRQLDLLDGRIARLLQRFQELEARAATGDDAAGDVPPPHY